MHGLVNGVPVSTGSFTTFMETGEAMVLNNFAYYRSTFARPYLPASDTGAEWRGTASQQKVG